MAYTEDNYVRSLWLKYKKEKDIESRNEIIIHYSGLVNRVVNRIATKYSDYIDIEDLISYGTIGLIDAIEKFDIEKGVKFSTYASFRIRGSIIDEIRQQDWIPRSLRTKSKEMGKALEELEMKLGRHAKDDELAEHLGVKKDELYKLMGQVHSFNILSLDEQIIEILGNIKQLSGNSKNPEEHIMVEELKNVLAQAIDILDENEKQIISLYYFEELTFKEIGKIIQVSESRISQLHSRALMKLKNWLKRVKIF